MTLGLYATDASIYQITPLALVVPRDVDDVLAAVRIAARQDLDVVELNARDRPERHLRRIAEHHPLACPVADVAFQPVAHDVARNREGDQKQDCENGENRQNRQQDD